MSQSKEVDIEALIEGQKFGWFRAWVLFWSCVLMFFEGYDMQATAYAAPSIIQAWHINKANFGSVFGLGLFGYMIGATLLSNLADRIGRKPVIIGGAFLFGVFTLATAFASSLSALLALRFIAGIGLGGSIPTVIALAVEYTPSRRRARIISVLWVGYAIGGATGGFVAARLIPQFGWASVFYVGGIVPIALAAVLTFTLPESVYFLALTRNRSKKVGAILARLQAGCDARRRRAVRSARRKTKRHPGGSSFYRRPSQNDAVAVVRVRHEPPRPLFSDELAAHRLGGGGCAAGTRGHRGRIVGGRRSGRRFHHVLVA